MRLQHPPWSWAAALAAYYLFRRNLFAGVLSGATVLVALTYLGTMGQ